jgi:hypothetical protein
MDEPCEWPWYGEAATLDWAADYPLHDAAEQGDATLVRALLHSRANPSLAEPQRGWTPLQYGAACGHHAVCQALLAAGVSLLEDDPEAELACPPLLLAFNSDSWPLTHLLLKELKRRGQLSEAGRVLFARCAGRPPDAAAVAVARTTSRAPAAAVPTAAHAALPPSRFRSSPADTKTQQDAVHGRRGGPGGGSVILGPGYCVTGGLAHACLLTSAVQAEREGVCVVNCLWAKAPPRALHARLLRGAHQLMAADNLGGAAGGARLSQDSAPYMRRLLVASRARAAPTKRGAPPQQRLELAVAFGARLGVSPRR